MRAATLQIRTPEGIAFSLALAGPVTRFLAWGIDMACISAAASLLGAPLRILGLLSPDIAEAAWIIVYFSLSIGYGILTEWLWRGQTPGKRVLGLRVIDEQALRLQFSQILIRNLLRFVDMLPACYLVGGAAVLASRRAQRLGDYAANTVVIRHPRIRQPDLDQIMAGKYNSLREHPVLAARLRQRVSPEEASLALRAIVRRDQLDPPARVALFQEIAAHFRSRVEFPPEASEGIADEQYVRNVVDIVFGSAAPEPR